MKLVLALSFLFLGCQLSPKPTEVFHKESYDTRILTDKASKPLEIGDDTIIVDARPPFERAMIKIPTSVHIEWRDFSQYRTSTPGKLKSDLFKETRRLASMGISPDSKVVVVGRGLKGEGEEGRVAWTLLYLGVKDVQVSDMDALGLRYTVNSNALQKNSAPIWEPELQVSLTTKLDELRKTLDEKKSSRIHIIDVRSEREYLSQRNTGARSQLTTDLEMVNIPWKEFYTDQGRPNLEIKTRLNSIGIRPSDRILVVSGRGIRGGAATYALLAMGYRNAANLPSGYTEL